MGQSYFIWKKHDCRSYGIVMQAPAAIIRPEERVGHVQIPGRSGDLTETEGEEVYNSYIQTASIAVNGGYRTGEIYRWLRGADYVTFSGEPERKQRARIIGAVTLNKQGHNLDWYTGEVQFYCQPLKEKLQDPPVTITSVGEIVQNGGDVIARPLFKAVASDTTLVISAGGKTLSIASTTIGRTYYIDSEIFTSYNHAGTDATYKSTGDWPVLLPGDNEIGGSGWSELEITRRERYL